MKRLLFLMIGIVLAMPPGLAAAATGDRLALVIGNDTYASVPSLDNAVADATAIAGRLEGLGFKVTSAQDLDFRATNRLLANFETAVTPGATVFVYFAGHGVAMGGANYLLPTDVERPGEGAENLIKAESYNVDDIIRRLQARGPASLMMVIDACRNNPFEAAGTRSVGATRGLARVDAPTGVFVLFSAGSGQTALDKLAGEQGGGNSVFTRVLMKYLGQPGLSHILMAKRVQSEVKALALQQSHNQQPAFYDQIDGEIVLTPSDVRAETDKQEVELPDETEKQEAKLPDDTAPVVEPPAPDANLPPTVPEADKQPPPPAATKPRLGIEMSRITDETAKTMGISPARGALVVRVLGGSVAERGGIRKGDVVLTYGKRTVWEMRDLPNWIAQTPAGSTVPIKIWRDTREVELRLDFGADGAATVAAGAPAGGWGMEMAAITESVRERYKLASSVRGVVVTGVSPGGPASGKLQPGDVIVEVTPNPVSTDTDVALRLDLARSDGRASALLMVSDPRGAHRFVSLPLK